MKKYKMGYTQGVFDMFHIGHLNLINRAKEYCESLIVAVNSDELVMQYKKKTPVINQDARRYIVENIKAVDEAVISHSLNKTEQFIKYSFDVIFVGDDWKGNERWKETEKEMNELGVDVVYLPYTPSVCSSDLRKVNQNRVDDEVKDESC